jgi:iron(III) transport system permease protein
LALPDVEALAVTAGPSFEAGPGRRWDGPPRSWVPRVLSSLRQGGRPAFFLAVTFVVLAPCACFLALAVSPRLFDQGRQWFTLHYLGTVVHGTTAEALANSIWVSVAAASLGLVIGVPLAWTVSRTTLPGRNAVRAGMWLVLLLPSWLPAIGWTRLVQTDGVMYRLGLHWPWVTHLILGPFGVVLLLGLRCVPFTFLAVSAALGGLGQEYEDAARVHGNRRWSAVRVLVPMLAPAITSALAIGFVESVSDFGVAATLAYSAHFPLATYQLYRAIYSFPPSFPAAAAIGWLLVASVAIPLVLQARALRGRSFEVLSGRTRPILPRVLSRRGTAGALGAVMLFFVVALAVPGLGAGAGSLMGDYGVSAHLTLVNYRQLFHDSSLLGPIERSLSYGLVAATITVVAGFAAARMLVRSKTRATRLLDFLLLAAVALPSVVFAAGYIFAYNLPALSKLGIDLYQTTTLLVIAYIAASLPTNARVLVGSVSQIQNSLHDAARTHGAGPVRAWLSAVLPVLSRPIVMAWLYTFAAVFLELPISQLLYAPNSPPISVAIQDNLSTYHFGVGMAQSVFAVVLAFGAVGLVLLGYRLLAPAGWRRIGALVRG